MGKPFQHNGLTASIIDANTLAEPEDAAGTGLTASAAETATAATITSPSVACRPETDLLTSCAHTIDAMKRSGLTFFGVAWAAFALTWLWRAVAGPDSFRAVDLALAGAMALFFTALFVGIAAWVPRMPPESLTKRHPEYWHLAEHRPELNARIADVFYGLAGAGVLMAVLLNVSELFSRFPAWAFVSIFVGAIFAVVINAARQLDSIARGGQMGADGDAGSIG